MHLSIANNKCNYWTVILNEWTKEVEALHRLKIGKWRDCLLLWHPVYPPLAISIFIKGNIVRLNCFQMVTEDGKKGCVLAAQLYGGYIDISVNIMPHQHHEYDLATLKSLCFFLFIGSLTPRGWGRSLTDLSDESQPCSDWAKKEYAREQTKWAHFTQTLSSFSISLISNLDHLPAGKTEGFSDLESPYYTQQRTSKNCWHARLKVGHWHQYA